MENELKAKQWVLVRDAKDLPWEIDIFKGCGGHYALGDCEYCCLGGQWKYCIPYEDNEELLDTTYMPKEKYKSKEILDDIERKYLSNFCKPFINNILYICKYNNIDSTQYIYIEYFNCLGDINSLTLPIFKKDTMYKNMELDIRYTPKELGLK